jgi:hypothetical protein
MHLDVPMIQEPHMLYHAANEPDILQVAEKRQNRILDADYRKVEVDPFI